MRESTSQSLDSTRARASRSVPLLGEETEAQVAKEMSERHEQVAMGMMTDTDIVQFSTAIYFGDEEEGRVSIGVMRLGSGIGQARVWYTTADGSALAGEQYEPVAGELVFEDREKDKSIEINLCDDDTWHATNEFKVHLSDAEGCILGTYLHTCRVKVLDQNIFPSDKYRDCVVAGKDETLQISGPGLFWEYFKLNFQNEGMWWRTALSLIFDQLHNINLLLQTWTAMYMVDVVFNMHDPHSFEHLRFFHDRLSEAYFMAALNIIPIAAMHLWDLIRVRMDVEGHSEAFLRGNLVRRYMNLTEESRTQLEASRFQVVILDDAHKIANGYCSVIDIIKSLGTVSVLTIFTLHSNPGAWWIVLLMPVVMGIFLTLRQMFSGMEDLTAEKQALLGLLNEMLTNYRLIASYYQRPRINEMFAKKVDELREKRIPMETSGKHDEFFPQWMGGVIIGVYMLVTAPLVLDGGGAISLGTFLATISIIRDIAGAFSLLYSIYVKLAETFDPLREVTWVFSLKTDLKGWKRINRERNQMTLAARSEMDNHPGKSKKVSAHSNEHKFPADRLKISLGNMSFGFGRAVPVFREVELYVNQGTVVAVSGEHASGKGTLLHILGHSIFPKKGHVFVPGHLRILQVDEEVMLFNSWSPLENLTFGVNASEVDMNLVRHVLDHFGMKKTWQLVQAEVISSQQPEEDDTAKPQGSQTHFRMSQLMLNTQELEKGSLESKPAGGVPWHEVLCQTEKMKICLARALIANPEVLILHKPFRCFGELTKANVMRAILEHIQNRGIGMSQETLFMRRPRTCFYSINHSQDGYLADVVWHVNAQSFQVTTLQEHSLAGNAAERLEKIRYATTDINRIIRRYTLHDDDDVTDTLQGDADQTNRITTGSFYQGEHAKDETNGEEPHEDAPNGVEAKRADADPKVADAPSARVSRVTLTSSAIGEQVLASGW